MILRPSRFPDWWALVAPRAKLLWATRLTIALALAGPLLSVADPYIRQLRPPDSLFYIIATLALLFFLLYACAKVVCVTVVVLVLLVTVNRKIPFSTKMQTATVGAAAGPLVLQWAKTVKQQ